MADRILSTVSRYLTPEIIGKLASASGLDRSVTQTAVDAAVPSILSSLAGLVSRPNGARQLANAVAQQPTDMLANIGGSLTGSALTGERGTSLLSSLLGSAPLGALTSTVSKFLGVGEGPMRMLMGLLTPVIMGVLGREQRAAGLDASGLARMLTGQKEEITAAMPAGLSGELETNTRLHESVVSPASPQRRTYEAAPAYATVQRARSETTGWRTNWPYWVLPLLALAGLLWYLLARGQETGEPVATSKSVTEPARNVPTKSAYLGSAPDNWVSIGSTPNEYVNKEIYSRAGEQLGTIKDILVGPDGKMAAAIINVGRNLGLGDKDVAVPFSALQQQPHDGGQRIVVDATKDALQAAPTFVRHQPTKP
jgi:sporulation protein YlmC with PRC-barrel domain